MRDARACWRATGSTYLGWLDGFYRGYEAILSAGTILKGRSKISLTAPLVGADDMVNLWTAISIAASSTSAPGTMSAANFTKLAGIGAGATVASIGAGTCTTVGGTASIPTVNVTAASASVPGSLSANDYKKIQALAPGAYLPIIRAIIDPPNASATAGLNAAIAFAPSTGSILISSVAIYPLGTLTASDTNYRTLGLYSVTPAGVPTLLASTDTRTIGSGGTGDWTAGIVVYTWTPVGGQVIAASDYLFAAWGHVNGGVAFPGVAYRVE